MSNQKFHYPLTKLSSLTISQRLESQQAFFESGKTLALTFRLKQLIRLKRIIKENEDLFLEALHKDLGKHPMEGYITEVGLVYEEINLAIQHLAQWMKPQKVRTPYFLMPAKSYMVYEPLGNVLIVAPFNYPFQLLVSPLVGAIAAGNTAIVKPSEKTPHTAEIVESILSHGFPASYIACVRGNRHVMSELLEQPFDHIFFTGSAAMGKVVMEKAAKHLTSVTLELGGKSPAIVDLNGDLAYAAKSIAWGKFLNAGQTCVAPDYVLVHEDAKEELMMELIFAIKALYSSETLASNSYGRIVDRQSFDRLMDLLDRESGTIVYGGQGKVEERWIAPTIVDTTWDSSTMEDEIFGPILPIISYRNIEEALSKVRKNPKPLALYVFSDDKGFQQKVLRDVSAGSVAINDTINQLANPNLPFGGVGNSGLGRYHGHYSFQCFSHQKPVLHRGKIAPTFAQAPYTKDKMNLIRKVMK